MGTRASIPMRSGDVSKFMKYLDSVILIRFGKFGKNWKIVVFTVEKMGESQLRNDNDSGKTTYRTSVFFPLSLLF